MHFWQEGGDHPANIPSRDRGRGQQMGVFQELLPPSLSRGPPGVTWSRCSLQFRDAPSPGLKFWLRQKLQWNSKLMIRNAMVWTASPYSNISLLFPGYCYCPPPSFFPVKKEQRDIWILLVSKIIEKKGNIIPAVREEGLYGEKTTQKIVYWRQKSTKSGKSATVRQLIANFCYFEKHTLG